MGGSEAFKGANILDTQSTSAPKSEGQGSEDSGGGSTDDPPPRLRRLRKLIAATWAFLALFTASPIFGEPTVASAPDHAKELFLLNTEKLIKIQNTENPDVRPVVITQLCKVVRVNLERMVDSSETTIGRQRITILLPFARLADVGRTAISNTITNVVIAEGRLPLSDVSYDNAHRVEICCARNNRSEGRLMSNGFALISSLNHPTRDVLLKKREVGYVKFWRFGRDQRLPLQIGNLGVIDERSKASYSYSESGQFERKAPPLWIQVALGFALIAIICGARLLFTGRWVPIGMIAFFGGFVLFVYAEWSWLSWRFPL